MYTSNKKKIKRGQYFWSSHQTPQRNYQEEFNEWENNRQIFQKENYAKKILIEIGKEDLGSSFQTYKKTHPAIDSWVNPQEGSTKKQEQRGKLLNITLNRNTQSLHGNFHKSNRNQWNDDNFIKLKQALKKLESPEKIKKKKEEKSQFLQNIARKRSHTTRVADLMRRKQTQSRDSSHNPSIVFRVTDYTKYKSSKPFFKLTKCEQVKLQKSPTKIENLTFKQARKNRTLKSLLQ